MLVWSLAPFAVLAAPKGKAQTIPVTARAEKHGKRQVGVLLIGGRTAVRIKTSYSGMEPGDRARIAAAKLWLRVDDGVSPSSIRAVKIDDRWTVSAGDTPFLYVTRKEARAQDSDSDSLARRWAAQIRTLLSQPALTLSAKNLVVPLNETRSVQISGWLANSPQSTVLAGKNAANAEVKAKTLVVRGIAPGASKIEVSAGSHSAACSVVVKKYAGNLKSTVRAQVTGRSAPPSLLAESAAFAIKRSFPREPGASLQLLSTPKTFRSLTAGSKVVLAAKVRLSGSNYIPVEGTARVEIENVKTPARKSSQLMYSNVPEQITRGGTLYLAEVPANASGRLFYHHINSAKSSAILTVSLVNPEEKPIHLQIVPGFVFPHPDPVQAGRRAGRAFFPRYLKNIGEVYMLPAKSSIPLVVDLLKPRDVGSGMAEVRLLEPESARFFVRVTASFKPVDSSTRVLAQRRDAWRQVMPRAATPVELAQAPDSLDLYPTTSKTVRAEYTVGDKWTWIPFGKEPITDSAGKRPLQGNYGVLYNIDLRLHNPGEQQRQVELAFEPT